MARRDKERAERRRPSGYGELGLAFAAPELSCKPLTPAGSSPETGPDWMLAVRIQEAGSRPLAFFEAEAAEAEEA
jgi:hypothetical protein